MKHNYTKPDMEIYSLGIADSDVITSSVSEPEGMQFDIDWIANPWNGGIQQ